MEQPAAIAGPMNSSVSEMGNKTAGIRKEL
jgi:hypothetical protein